MGAESGPPRMSVPTGWRGADPTNLISEKQTRQEQIVPAVLSFAGEICFARENHVVNICDHLHYLLMSHTNQYMQAYRKV